jgi:predicted AlkP superfamily phosphohydrolase/phosphomutase
MSDHGFGPFHKFIHLNNWLRQQGWLQLKNSAWAQAKSRLFGLGFTPMGVYNLLMRLGLGAFKREVVRGRGQGLLKRLFLSFDDVDWQRTVAYSLGNVGQINLNVRGREPQGCVDPGESYEALRSEIVDRLYQLRDPETDERVVEKAYRREEIYWGRNVEKAADIVFIPTRLEYFGFGEYEFGSHEIIERVKRGISGTHRLNGMVLFWGAASSVGVQLENAHITDLAPTILHMMGQAVPEDMDGHVLTKALNVRYAGGEGIGRGYETESAQSEYSAGEDPGGAAGADDLTEKEKELIANRLRGLGYVG